MAISYAQVQKLFKLVAVAVPDQMDCDGCFELFAELAEAELRGEELSESLKRVQVHFSQCPCCAYEYATLLEGIEWAGV